MKHIYNPATIIAGFVFSLLLPCLAAAQIDDTQQQQVDSFLNVIATSGGENKQNAYIKLLSEKVFGNLSQDSILQLHAEGIREMRRQGNKKYEGHFKYLHINELFNAGLNQEVMATAPEYLKYLAETGRWEHYYDMYGTLLDSYMEEYMFETATRKARELYDEANSKKHEEGISVATLTLANAYRNLNRLEDAEEYYRKTISILYRRERPITILDAYYKLVEILSEQKRFAEAQEMLQEYGKAVDRLEALDKRPFFVSRYSLHLLQAILYIDMKEFDKAEPFVDLAEEQLPGMERALMNTTYYRAQIAEARKDYPQALELCNEAVRLCKIAAADFHLSGVLKTKAQIMAKMLNAEEISDLYEEHIALRDSFERRQNQSLLDELRTQYEVDRHIAEKQRNFNYFLFALGGAALLLVLVVVILINRQKIHRKNAALVKQILEQDKAVDARAHLQSLQTPDETQKDEDELFSRIEKYMYENKPFTNIDCNRKSLADALFTNENYLSQSIRKNTGLTPKNYIDSYRLQVAKNLLLQSNSTIEAVCEDSGFGSRHAFNDVFRNHYGLSPTEFRKIAREEGR